MYESAGMNRNVKFKTRRENLQQLKLIAQREEALKDKEEVLNQARTELEAEYLDRRQKRLEFETWQWDVHGKLK
eukprot:g17123.t1